MRLRWGYHQYDSGLCVALCFDFDDVTVNVNQYDNSMKSQNDANEDTNYVNPSDKSNHIIGVYKNYILSNDASPLHDRHQLNVDHLVAESTSQDTSCPGIGDPCNGISHTYVHQNKAKIAFMTKEVGLHNISRQYFNRLNVVLSVMLVVCCVVGIGLFLLYMLSCDGYSLCCWMYHISSHGQENNGFTAGYFLIQKLRDSQGNYLVWLNGWCLEITRSFIQKFKYFQV